MARSRMRVVAGEVGGLPLLAPPGARPTTGRVREAVFASLGDLAGARVLDLYAGSGALGIEALSRGAVCVVFVEIDRAAIDVIHENLATTGTTDRARTLLRSAGAATSGPPMPEAPFDLVLADPPYDDDPGELEGTLGALLRRGWLAPSARIVLESAARTGPGPIPEDYVVASERKYGDTLVTVLSASQAT
jgi:16S rRNA (guanine966-N2)-methyltransferase